MAGPYSTKDLSPNTLKRAQKNSEMITGIN